jgi:hypothetical protein
MTDFVTFPGRLLSWPYRGEKSSPALHCRSARVRLSIGSQRGPRRNCRTTLILLRKSAPRRGADRLRSGPLHAIHFAGNFNVFPTFGVGSRLGAETQLGPRGTPSVTCSDEVAILAARPIASLGPTTAGRRHVIRLTSAKRAEINGRNRYEDPPRPIPIPRPDEPPVVDEAANKSIKTICRELRLSRKVAKASGRASG